MYVDNALPHDFVDKPLVNKKHLPHSLKQKSQANVVYIYFFISEISGKSRKDFLLHQKNFIINVPKLRKC